MVARQERSASLTIFKVRRILPGLTLIESMPMCVRKREIFGQSAGASPQMPMWQWLRLAPATAMRSISSMPGSRSSKSNATISESRSAPSASCVRSFDRIENRRISWRRHRPG